MNVCVSEREKQVKWIETSGKTSFSCSFINDDELADGSSARSRVGLSL